MKNIFCLFILVAGLAFAGDVPYPVVGTGQSKCYDERSEIPPPQPGQTFYGQDAQQHSPRASYAHSADGRTVQDNITGLTWQRSPDTNGDGHLDRGDKLTLAQARALPAKLNAAKFGGFGDWRLPDVKELQSIVDYTRSPGTTGSAAIDPVFQCTTITNEDGKADFPFPHGRGPQGDVIRINNFVRVVRNTSAP